MSDQGWIKLHRKLLKNPISLKPTWAWLWVYLLLKANHEENSIIWNGKPMVIKRGQLLTGRNTIRKESGVTAQSTRSCLNYLKVTNQVTIQTSNRWSIITICNYDQYQEVTSKVNNQQPTRNQQATTNKNDKTVENVKNNTDLEEFVSKFNQLFGKNYRVTTGLRKKYQERLKTFSHSELLSAVESLAKSKFHKGDNDRGWFADPSFLLRNDEQVDKWRAKDEVIKPTVPTLASMIPDSVTNY